MIFFLTADLESEMLSSVRDF